VKGSFGVTLRPVAIDTDVERYLAGRRAALDREIEEVGRLADQGKLDSVDLTGGELVISPVRDLAVGRDDIGRGQRQFPAVVAVDAGQRLIIRRQGGAQFLGQRIDEAERARDPVAGIAQHIEAELVHLRRRHRAAVGTPAAAVERHHCRTDAELSCEGD